MTRYCTCITVHLELMIELRQAFFFSPSLNFLTSLFFSIYLWTLYFFLSSALNTLWFLFSQNDGSSFYLFTLQRYIALFFCTVAEVVSGIRVCWQATNFSLSHITQLNFTFAHFLCSLLLCCLLCRVSNFIHTSSKKWKRIIDEEMVIIQSIGHKSGATNLCYKLV